MISLNFYQAGYCRHPEYTIIKNGSLRPKNFPIICTLIHHSKFGHILFDVGYSQEFFNAAKMFPYALYKLLTPVHIPITLRESLLADGVDPLNIKYIFVSHFHADHIAAIDDFPNAEIICSREAYEFAKKTTGFKGVIKGILPYLVAKFKYRKLDFIECKKQTSGLYLFNIAYDIFGDESLLAVPLPGHATGHFGLYCQDAHKFLVGDACWIKKAYMNNTLPHWITKMLHHNHLEYSATLSKLHTLYKLYPKKLKLNKFLKWLCSHSPFYSAYNGRPLEDFPVMNKTSMMENLSSINTLGLKSQELLNFVRTCYEKKLYSLNYNDITVGLSSGTSGKTGIFFASSSERNLWSGIMLSKALKGLQLQKHRIAFCFRNNSTLYQNLNSKIINFKFIDITNGIDYVASELCKYQPTILVAPTCVLTLLIKSIKNHQINPVRIFSVAEVLEPDVETKLSAFFSQKIFQIYQCTEGFLGMSSPYHDGVIMNEEYVFIEKEWVDENRFVPIITDFSRTSQPIVRYRLDDILVVPDKQDDIPFTILNAIEERYDDILYLKKRNDSKLMPIFADSVRNIFCKQSAVSDYQIEQNSHNQFVIKIDPLSEDIKGYISQAIQNLCNLLQLSYPYITFFRLDSINPNQKHRRIKRNFNIEDFR